MTRIRPAATSGSASGNAAALVAYFVGAFGISWAIAAPLALAHQGILPPVLPSWSHYLIGFGPALSAFVVGARIQGRRAVRDLLARITSWKVSPVWWVVALSPLVMGALAAVTLNRVTDHAIGPSDLGHVHFLPPLGLLALPLWLLTFGIGEETGWRGFALPRLQRGRSALSATFILAALWALWHLPQFFYLFDPSIAVGWLVGLLAGAIVLTWLVNSTEGSVLIVSVWHGTFNFVTASPAGNGLLAAVVSTAVIVWAILLVFLFKPTNLSHRARAEFPGYSPNG